MVLAYYVFFTKGGYPEIVSDVLSGLVPGVYGGATYFQNSVRFSGTRVSAFFICAHKKNTSLPALIFGHFVLMAILNRVKALSSSEVVIRLLG
jgi:hypothetical protein